MLECEDIYILINYILCMKITGYTKDQKMYLVFQVNECPPINLYLSKL